MSDILSIFKKDRETFLIGDLNICFINERCNAILQWLEELGFKQQVKEPTHTEGRQIDHIFHYSPHPNTVSFANINQFGVYFTDHDMIQINLKQVRY